MASVFTSPASSLKSCCQSRVSVSRSTSRNKVSIGEPAKGSLTNGSADTIEEALQVYLDDTLISFSRNLDLVVIVLLLWLVEFLELPLDSNTGSQILLAYIVSPIDWLWQLVKLDKRYHFFLLLLSLLWGNCVYENSSVWMSGLKATEQILELPELKLKKEVAFTWQCM